MLVAIAKVGDQESIRKKQKVKSIEISRLKI